MHELTQLGIPSLHLWCFQRFTSKTRYWLWLTNLWHFYTISINNVSLDNDNKVLLILNNFETYPSIPINKLVKKMVSLCLHSHLTSVTSCNLCINLCLVRLRNTITKHAMIGLWHILELQWLFTMSLNALALLMHFPLRQLIYRVDSWNYDLTYFWRRCISKLICYW